MSLIAKNVGSNGKTLGDGIYTALLARIRSGEFAVGVALPPVRDLAKEYGTSISPVYSAMAALEREGFVKRYHGSQVRVESDKSIKRSARTHPVVDVLTSINPAEIPGRPVHPHLLDSIQQLLISHLQRHGDIRIMLSSFFDASGSVNFSDRLEDAIQLRPQVCVFAKPENFSDAELALLMRLKQHGTYVVYYAARREVREFDRARSDFAAGQEALTKYVLEKKRGKLIRFSVNRQYQYERAKQDGFVSAFNQAGLGADEAEQSTMELPQMPHPCWRQVDYMIRTLRPLFEQGDPPTSLMAVSDGHAASVRLALRMLGVQNVLVTGYDANWAELAQAGAILEDVSAETFPDELSLGNPPPSVDTCLPEISAALSRLVLGRCQGELGREALVEITPQRLFVPELR